MLSNLLLADKDFDHVLQLHLLMRFWKSFLAKLGKKEIKISILMWLTLWLQVKSLSLQTFTKYGVVTQPNPWVIGCNENNTASINLDKQK